MNDYLLSIKSVFQGLQNFYFLKFLPSFIIPFAGFLFGYENDKVLLALFLLVAFDFITGIVAAHMAGERIRSRIAVRSAFKVAIYGLLVSSGHLTEQITPGTTFIEEAITTFLALTELISILENAGKMGYAVPQKLLNQLQNWRNDEIIKVPVET